jgi:hypothetical protein
VEELDISSITHKPEKKLTSEQEILSEKQKGCLPTSQLLTNNTFQISDSKLQEIFHHLSLEARPHPELFHLYFKEDSQSQFKLIKKEGTITLQKVKLYGNTEVERLNYTTAYDH